MYFFLQNINFSLKAIEKEIISLIRIQICNLPLIQSQMKQSFGEKKGGRKGMVLAIDVF